MRNILLALLVSICTQSLLAQGAPPHQAADQPYIMEYYYKVQWGHQQEFLQLFLKNHYPLLQKNVESGRMLSVRVETAGQPHHRGWTLGLPGYDPVQELDLGDHRQSRRRTPHPAALARSGEVQTRGAAAVRDPAGPLGSSGHRYHTRDEIAGPCSTCRHRTWFRAG